MTELKPAISRMGDFGLLLRWSMGSVAARNAEVHRLAAVLLQRRPPWLLDVVPAYASLAVLIDPNNGALNQAAMPLLAAERWLAQAIVAEYAPAAWRDETHSKCQRCVEIPVCYETEFGLDLLDLARACNMEVATLIARHCAPTYRVAMLGFAPGFPYLLGLDPALAMPRLSTPRVRVEAGSVGIGGDQTGVYPGASAGGWRLLGRTPLTLFDAQRDPPSLLLAGDALRFVAISRASFEAWHG